VWHVKEMGLESWDMIKRLASGHPALYYSHRVIRKVNESDLVPLYKPLSFPSPEFLLPLLLSGLVVPASSSPTSGREGPNQGPMTQAGGGGGCFGCRSADAGALCSYILLNLLPEEGARARERIRWSTLI
jgi:hypothetical protein